MNAVELTQCAATTIRRLMTRQGWDQKTLAAKAGIAPPHISTLLSGTRATSFDTLARIAVALDVDPRQLVSGPSVPIYPDAIACGPPSEFTEVQAEDWLPVGTLFGPPEDVFAVRSRGRSLTGAGVMPGDVLMIRKQPVAEPGQKVLARVNGEHTLKIYTRRGRKFWLEPAGDEGEAILFDDDTAIEGVVVGLIRRE